MEEGAGLRLYFTFKVLTLGVLQEVGAVLRCSKGTLEGALLVDFQSIETL